MSDVNWQKDYLHRMEHPAAQLNRKPVYWDTDNSNDKTAPAISKEEFIATFNRLRSKFETGYFPTSPGTVTEDYFETVRMGDILSALISAGDTKIAEDILLGSESSIYSITNGGRLELANFYESYEAF